MTDEFMPARVRERSFLVGALLAIVPALAFLPAVTFLIIFPRIAYGRLLGIFLLPACALVGFYGLWKLAIGVIQKPWGIFNALSLGALIVLLVIAAYTGLFLAILATKL